MLRLLTLPLPAEHIDHFVVDGLQIDGLSGSFQRFDDLPDLKPPGLLSIGYRSPRLPLMESDYNIVLPASGCSHCLSPILLVHRITAT